MPGALAGSAAADISARKRFERAFTSRRGNEARADERIFFEVDHPRRAFVETALARLHDLALHQLLDELPHDVTVRAEHHVVQLGITDEFHRTREPMALGEILRLFDLQLAGAGQRLPCLHAPGKGARENARAAE